MTGVGPALVGDPSSDNDQSQFSVEHRARRLSARTAPAKPPRSKRRRIVRDLALIGGIVAVVVLLRPFADVPNPEYPEASAIAERLNAAYRSAWSGGVSLEAAASAESLVVYRYPAGEGTVSLVTHTHPTAADTCYGMRMGDGFSTLVVEFAPTDGCVPQGQSVFREAGLWGDVLPSERITTVWFIPALIVLVGLMVALTTNIVVELVRDRSMM